jgi:hypothetical protein
MDRVALRVSEDLHLNVAWALEEAFDEDSAIAERGLGLAHGALEGNLEFGFLTDDTHATASATHRGLDDDCTGPRT